MVVGSTINLSNNAGFSVFPQVAVSGSNIYSVWQDTTPGNADIFFSKSTDGGATFSTPVNLSNNTGTSLSPKIAASGSNVYVVWQDGTGGSAGILYEQSTDSGATFNGGSSSTPGAPINLSNSTTSSSAQIISSGTNVYVVWQDAASGNLEILYQRSADSGATFNGGSSSTPGTPINLSNNTGSSTSAKIAASGTGVYVVWQDATVGSEGILYEQSTDSGATFNGGSSSTPGAPINLSSSTSSTLPKISAAGSNVYVVWQDTSPGNSDILYEQSTDNGTTFNGGSSSTPGAAINLSNNSGSSTASQIAASGTNVYVVWQDDTPGNSDILYEKSSDSGATFNGGSSSTPGAPINLSNNSGGSATAQIAVSGTFVYVVWQDNTSDANEILLVPSTDSGSTFGSFSTLSSVSGSSTNAQAAASSSSVYATWQDSTLNHDVFFIAGTNPTTSAVFNATQYKMSQTAEITVTNSSASGSVSVNVNSTRDGTGINLVLAETGLGTGIFKGTFTFTAGSSSASELAAAQGNTITVNYNGITSTASIFPTIVAYDFVQYNLGSIAHISVTDQNSNLDPTTNEIITAHVTTTGNPSGIDLQLTETGPDTGVFGGSASNLIFMTGNQLFPTSGTVTVAQENFNINGSGTTFETVKSTTDPVGITLTLNETGNSTGEFVGKLKLSTGSSNSTTGTIKVSVGDILSVTSTFNFKTNALITPNPNPANGAILVGGPPDNVTASYHGVSTNATVLFAPGEGGGGSGGLVRPGLTLDVLAGIFGKGGSSYVPPTLSLSALALSPGALPDEIKNEVLNQDPYKPMGPSTNTSFEFPFYIDGGGYVLAGHTNTIVTRTESTGTPVGITLNIPASNIQHIAFYTNLRGTEREIPQSDTYIIYDKGQQLQIVDPQGYIAHVDFDMTKNGYKNTVKFGITFAKPMEKSDIDLRVWDDRKSTSDTRILDVWQVESQPQTQVSKTSQLTNPPVQNIQEVSQLQTTNLLSSIKDWGGFTPNPISDSQMLSVMDIQGNHIPSWVMKTTKWVVNGDISQQDFVVIMKYLSENGML